MGRVRFISRGLIFVLIRDIGDRRIEQRDVSLIVGVDGLTGRALRTHLVHHGESVIETTRRLNTVSKRRIFLDLTEDVSNWYPPCHVSVAYLCAAVTPLEKCRREATQSAIVDSLSIIAILVYQIRINKS